MGCRNLLWRPTAKDKHKKGIKEKFIPDELCTGCKHIKKCTTPCKPMIWINGNTPLKEPLFRDISDQDNIRDYNEELAELIEDRQQRIDKAVGIEDIRQRAITILLLAGIKKKQIATLFSMSPRQIIRICKHIKV